MTMRSTAALAGLAAACLLGGQLRAAPADYVR